MQTDFPQIEPLFGGSAVAMKSSDGSLRIIISDLMTPGSTCEPAQLEVDGAKLANTFTLTLDVPALDSHGNVVNGTYSSATAQFELTDSSCAVASAGSPTPATVEIDGAVEGTAAVNFPGSRFVVTFDAPICEPATDASAAPVCVQLPFCSDGGTVACSNALP